LLCLGGAIELQWPKCAETEQGDCQDFSLHNRASVAQTKNYKPVKISVEN
jgi:hypothetical protein